MNPQRRKFLEVGKSGARMVNENMYLYCSAGDAFMQPAMPTQDWESTIFQVSEGRKRNNILRAFIAACTPQPRLLVSPNQLDSPDSKLLLKSTRTHKNLQKNKVSVMNNFFHLTLNLGLLRQVKSSPLTNLLNGQLKA